MKTLKLNLDKQVKNVSAKTEAVESTENPDSDASLSQYKEKIKKLENQVKMLENSLQNSREEAFQAGIEEGKEQAQLKFEKLEEKYQTNYQQLLQSIENKFENTLQESVNPLLNLAYEIAKKIIQNELKHKSDYSQFLEKQINKHINDIIDQGRLTIHLSPAQIQHVEKDNLNHELAAKSMIHLVENSELEPGDCIIETRDIKIDARIDRQIENLKSQNENTL